MGWYKGERQAGQSPAKLQFPHNNMDIDSSSAGNAVLAASPAMELRSLAASLYRARTGQAGQAGDDTGEDTSHLLHLGLAHFAASRTALRKTAGSNKADKASVAVTRQRMDAAYLALQNRMYEISHLYREIDRCNDYEWVQLCVLPTWSIY